MSTPNSPSAMPERCPNCGQPVDRRSRHVEWASANEGYWTCRAPEPFHPKPVIENEQSPLSAPAPAPSENDDYPTRSLEVN